MTPNSVLNRLKGRELAAVSFVRDYLQLQFEPGLLNLYAWPAVIRDEVKLELGDSGYRDSICDQIGRQVMHVSNSNDLITFVFSGGATLAVALGQHNSPTPEAMMFQDEDGQVWDVW